MQTTPTPTQIAISKAHNALSEVRTDYRALHTSAVALRGLIETQRNQLVFAVTTSPPAASGHAGNAAGELFIMARDSVATLAGMETLLDVIERSPDYPEASKTVSAIEAELAELEARDLLERQYLATKVATLDAAVQKAKAKALAAVESDPDVIAAAAALAK